MITNLIISNNSTNPTIYELLSNYFSAKISINHCPHCKSTKFIKYGKFNDSQRYLCKNCNRTFSKTTNTPRYYSKKNSNYWQKYITLLCTATSLRQSAQKNKINLKTAFIWRHKILHALESMIETSELNDCIEMRKLFIKENYKGNRTKIVNEARKVWIIASSDSNDDTFAKAVSLGLWKKRNFDKLVYYKLNKKSYIKAFGDNYIKSIALKHNVGKAEKSSSASISLINRFIGNIKGIISNCRGVATKYLPHYFSLAKILSLVKNFSILELNNNISNFSSYIPGDNLKEILPSFETV